MFIIKTIVKRQKWQIVYHSNVIRQPQYRGVFRALEKYPNRITDEDLETDTSISTKDKDIIINAFDEIYDVAKTEWEAVAQNTVGSAKCSLCNQNNEIIFFIRNKITKAKLNVGSTCVTYFSNLKNAKGTSIQKLFRDAKQSQIKVERKTTFKKAIPNYDMQIANAIAVCNDSSILLPKELYENLDKMIIEVKNEARKYLSGVGSSKESKCALDDMQIKLKALECYCDNDVQNWIASNCHSQFVCKRPEFRWLSSQGKESIINKIRENNSCYDFQTIGEVAYLPFVKRCLPHIKKKMSSLFSWMNIEGSKIYVSFSNKNISSLAFEMDISDFMKQFGKLYLLDESFKQNSLKYYLSNVVHLENSNQNIYAFFNVLNRCFGTEHPASCYEFVYKDRRNVSYIIRHTHPEVCVRYNGYISLVKYLLHFVERSDSYMSAKKCFFDQLNNWKPKEDMDTDDEIFEMSLNKHI